MGVRPRQHALSPSPQFVAAGRRPHPHLHLELSRRGARRRLPHPEGFLQALRHQPARPRARARHGPGRLSRIRPRDRSLAARAQPCARRGAGKAAGPQAHPHQRHQGPCRRGDAPPRDRTTISRTCSTSSPASLQPKPFPENYDRFLARHGVDAGKGGDVRGPRPQSRGAACARHDDGAGGAARELRSRRARAGSWRAATRPCRPRDRRSCRISGGRAGVAAQGDRSPPALDRSLAAAPASRTRPRPRHSRRRGPPCRMPNSPRPSTTPSSGAPASVRRPRAPVREAVDHALDLLDGGDVRVAERQADGAWQVNQWLKKAVLLSFRLNDMTLSRGGAGPARRGWDKVPLEIRRLGRARSSARRNSARCPARSCAARPISRRTWC